MKDKILKDFELQTDHQISARRLDIVLVKKIKRICFLVNLVVCR